MIHPLLNTVVLWGAGLAAASAATTQPGRSLAASIPADAMVVYFNRPPADLRDQAQVAARVASLLVTASVFGVVPSQWQGLTDAASCLPLIGARDHAVALLDVSSRQYGPQSYRLEQLKLALLLRTGRHNEQIVAQVRRLLSRYTNRSLARLETIQIGQDRFQRLADSRLPGWAVIAFGPLDDLYVLTLGRGAYQRVLAAHRGRLARLADDAWFDQAHRRTGGPDALVEWMIDWQRIRSRLGQVVQGRPQAVIDQLGFAGVQRGLWSIRMVGPAMAWFGMHRGPEGDRLVAISDPASFPPEQLSAVPTGAAYAMTAIDFAELARRLAKAYLAARAPASAEAIRAGFERLQQQMGIDLMAELFEQLGPYLIIHNYPPHPLNMPLACTILIQLRHRASVQASLDALLSAWDAHLVSLARSPGEQLLGPRVRRDADGLWYLQAGIIGPALAVTERYLVISWSPQAVRANLKLLCSAQSAPAASRPPQP